MLCDLMEVVGECGAFAMMSMGLLTKIWDKI